MKGLGGDLPSSGKSVTEADLEKELRRHSLGLIILFILFTITVFVAGVYYEQYQELKSQQEKPPAGRYYSPQQLLDKPSRPRKGLI